MMIKPAQFMVLFLVFFNSCGDGEEGSKISTFQTNPVNQGDGKDVSNSSYTYDSFGLNPELDQEIEITKTGKAFLISGEVQMLSKDYCDVKVRVAIQEPGSKEWKLVRNFRHRTDGPSNSITRPNVSFVLPQGGKFKVYDLTATPSENYPDSPCGPDNVEILGFKVFRIQ